MVGGDVRFERHRHPRCKLCFTQQESSAKHEIHSCDESESSAAARAAKNEAKEVRGNRPVYGRVEQRTSNKLTIASQQAVGPAHHFSARETREA
eukprot:1005721-Pleurochrysis_carterae.AAC.4